MTQKQIFLDWCKENGLKPKQTEEHRFVLTIEKLLVGGIELDINPHQNTNELDFWFDPNGDFVGGNPIVWNTGLPFMDR